MERAEERIALIEWLERDGRPGRSVDVFTWPVTLGRSLVNQVVLDDAHVAPRHARIEQDGQGSVRLTVLETANGVVVDGKRHAAGAICSLPAAGATLQLGHTRLRLRLPGEVLAEEKPLPAASSAVLLLAVPLFALMLAEQALRLDPGAEPAAWLPILIGWPLAMAGWCLVWALLSKMFQHRFDFGGHLRIALPWFLAIQLVDALLPQLAAALAWPWLWRSTGPLQILLGALWLRAHLAHLLPAHHRTVSAVIASVTLAGSAVALSFIYRDIDSFSRAPYMSTLPLPATRLTGTVKPALLVDDMATLAEPLARRAKKAREKEREESADSAD